MKKLPFIRTSMWENGVVTQRCKRLRKYKMREKSVVGVPLNLGKVDLKSGSAVTPGQVASVGVPAYPMTPHLHATHTLTNTVEQSQNTRGTDQSQHKKSTREQILTPAHTHTHTKKQTNKARGSIHAHPD